MPITRKQFELEIDEKIEEWMKKVYDFLANHIDEGFSVGELENQWRPQIDTSSWISYEEEAFKKALEKLVELQAIEIRSIRGKYYYSCGRRPLEI